ncbi:carboxypeptidase-like regulatory domain-containing protein [Hymenobacter rubripertinctus]|uniref:carboxypeptidase-like regulatory domain-containing protein n=1 Tax=Hymenobacter rubripertinctus TaxID=2029981 RepID=UPI00160259F1|nr:carboxypeptidase-like regulatory domain-containing protein [Hymenobacter rubripertinctus]
MSTFAFWLSHVVASAFYPAAGPLPRVSGAPVQQGVARELFGHVTDFTGAPLAGATVAVEEDRKSSVITNSVGKFLLVSPQRQPQLRISSAGYYDTLVAVTTLNTSIEVQLRPIDRYKRKLKKQYKAANKAWKN